MTDPLDRLLAEARQAPSTPRGEASKVVPLAALIRNHVRPGMTLHLGVTHQFPQAQTAELIRAFVGTDPRFTLVAAGVSGFAVAALHLGLVRRVVTSYAGDIYPSPAPNKVVQRVYAEGSVAFEHWSLLTLVQRLVAGALGLPAMPTRSLAGSTMAGDNAHAFRQVDDPFGGDAPLGLVAPLRPDLTLLHVPAADEDGNCLLTPPLSEAPLGAMAARGGVLVTAEHVVERDVIREHAGLARLPDRHVRAVAHAPFGGHPGGLCDAGLPWLEPHAEDPPFLVAFRRACRAPADLDAWIERWVRAPGDHAGYLAALGEERLADLRARGLPDRWERELTERAGDLDLDAPATPTERMVLAAADLICARVQGAGHRTILAGQGLSNLGAWIAERRLRRAGVPVELAAEIGMLGYTPRPANPFLFNFANLPTSTTLSDTWHALGVEVGGAGARAIGSLGAGQVDRQGNVNSTAVPPVFHLVGSGGANDVASAAAEVVLTCPADPLRLVDQVPYRTFTGRRVRALVTTAGALTKPAGDHDLVLSAVPGPPEARRDAVERARAVFGWPLSVADELATFDDPDPEELRWLRAFDPDRAFLGD